MLIDAILACAPAVVAIPAAFTLLTSQSSVASRAHVEKGLYRTLLIAEKLPPSAAYAPQIAKDIDRQTLHVAYVARYPERAREIVRLALIAVLALGVLVGYYVLLATDAAFLTVVIALAVFAIAALWLQRALRNFNSNDAVVRELFAHFGATDGLVRPGTEMIAKAPALRVDAIFERAADVRDANHDAATSTLDAVNAALTQAHSHFDWRVEAGRLERLAREVDYRGHATAGVGWAVARVAIAYDWLLRRLVGPVFTWRLTFLDASERLRTAKAQQTGDVFRAAWLTTYYRNERRRLAEHWTQLHKARDPLLSTGSHVHAPVAEPNYVATPVS
jgi:hypothetical protein